MLAEAWGLHIRRDAPPEIIEKLREAFLWACQQDELKKFAEDNALNLVGYTGEDAAKMADYQYSAYAYILYKAGLAELNPEEVGIVKVADWDWEKRKGEYGF
ncbi:MAG: hypothetical protein LIP77_00655 [Planctomycetes bacterium]|nr:hypothetical protein [Planctomycetota bacterium]